ncbi:Phytochrome, two-component sensor histidine kinase; Cyanobacterial phytochrome B [hydrothermal vent metagenome]|uniref:Phytochrome, two-component sensor histidine kinase Cyanobacterial phytochrome B n=1 Tax=hydrothermal vent metagenome TaxID=652676 RepID=A0A3B1BJP8_9ZZZZ
MLIISSVSVNFSLIRSQALLILRLRKPAAWNKDQAFRAWATRHEGLYVKPDARTPPTPFMAHLPQRDVETTEGMKLTLMNSAYMMSQLAGEFEQLYGIKGRISGQVLLNPA